MIDPLVWSALLVAVATTGAPGEDAPAAAVAPGTLEPAAVHDVEARNGLFDRGVPVNPESFSPDGFHFAYLHTIPGGIFRRRPQRCAFLLDLVAAENGPVKAPKGVAIRLGGWDPTGRYLLVETMDRGFFGLSSAATTYHWIFDVVASDFVTRRSFTGMRDGNRFRWKVTKTYHGEWGPNGDQVYPMYEGELADAYRAYDEALDQETARRLEFASHLGVETGDHPADALAEFLPRLDEHWTQRGHRDPVVSELFGERPTLYWERAGEWIPVWKETEYAAVLDHGLALITGQGGAQVVFCPDRWEMLLLPPVPPAFIERLETRWDRASGFFDEHDPLPRDLQYRRSADSGTGLAYYFNYVTSDRQRLLIVYILGPDKRVLRIVDLPDAWAMPAPPAQAADEG
jgi:hypothetical protein